MSSVVRRLRKHLDPSAVDRARDAVAHRFSYAYGKTRRARRARRLILQGFRRSQGKRQPSTDATPPVA